MTARVLLLIAMLWPGSQLLVFAQHNHHQATHIPITDSSTVAFIETVRLATQKYRDVRVAITDGYRPIGPDMPNMGQHWINPELAMHSEIVHGQPGMLTYLRIDSVDVFTGVAFTIPVFDGKPPPELNFQGASWHYHFRTLETEAISPPHHDDTQSGHRLAMLHVWAWEDNPDGIFAADNWALPYARLGMEVPKKVSPTSAKALFLMDGGVEYYSSMAGKVGGIDGADLEVLRAHLESAKEKASRITAESKGTPEKLDSQLQDVWKALRKGVAKDLGRKKWKAMGYILG